MQSLERNHCVGDVLVELLLFLLLKGQSLLQCRRETYSLPHVTAEHETLLKRAFRWGGRAHLGGQQHAD